MIILGHRYSSKQISFILILFGTVIYLFRLYNSLASNSLEDFRPFLDVEDVRLVLRAQDDSGINLVLFDPLIIHAWKSNDHLMNPGSCIFLCHVVGPLTFSVTDAELKEKPYFLPRLAQLGFTITQFFNDDGNRTHIFLMRSGTALHITVLHWSKAGYWRQFHLSGQPHQMALVKQFISHEFWTILNMDRAYETFSTNKAVIDGFMLSVPTDVEKFVEDYKNAKFIPCNHTQANYFYSKYNKLTDPEVKRFQHSAWKALAKSKTILDKIGVPFWLSSGTLLGFYRQCNIIPWALDVDVGIFIGDYSSHIISKFETAGMRLTHRFGKLEDSFELSFSEKDIKVDVFFFYTEGANIWNGGTQAKTGKKFKYIFPSFTLCWTEFLDLKVRIPCQTGDYIEANYGKNWFVPQKTWDWKTSPPNVIENGEWSEDELEEVIFVEGL